VRDCPVRAPPECLAEDCPRFIDPIFSRVACGVVDGVAFKGGPAVRRLRAPVNGVAEGCSFILDFVLLGGLGPPVGGRLWPVSYSAPGAGGGLVF